MLTHEDRCEAWYQLTRSKVADWPEYLFQSFMFYITTSLKEFKVWYEEMDELYGDVE